MISTLTRQMQRTDLPTVLRIETLSFTEPVEQKEFLKYLDDNCICLVSEVDDEVIGYLMYRQLINELEIIRIAVHPRWRRLKIGTRLIDRVLRRYVSEGLTQFEVMSAMVPERNVTCQIFLRENHFWTGDPRMFKMTDHNGEDLYLMTRAILH